MYRVRNSVQSIAPTTTIASGFCACEPIDDAMAAGKEAERSRERGHHDRPDPQLGAAEAGFPDGVAARTHLVAVGDEENSVLHGHAEDRNEADRPRDAEMRAGQVKRKDASHRGFENVDHHQQAVFHRREH